MRLMTGANTKKLFLSKFTLSFCKLDLFIIDHYFAIVLKWSSLQKEGAHYSKMSF